MVKTDKRVQTRASRLSGASSSRQDFRRVLVLPGNRSGSPSPVEKASVINGLRPKTMTSK